MGSLGISTGFAHSVALQNADLLECHGLIGGAWVAAHNDKTFPVHDPSTGKVLGLVGDFGEDDFIRAIRSAEVAYRQFSRNTTAKERAVLLQRWEQLILENADDLATIISLENGKTLAEAKAEVLSTASFAGWFAGEAVRSYGDVVPSSQKNTTVLVTKEPVGVCGIITPWNFPASMITRKIAPAFAAGCSVVIKPPSETPFSALALAKLCIQAGFPKDLIHVVPTRDRSASLQLATHPFVRKLSFTGSTAVGIMLSKLAAGTMKRVSMGLGGNAPFIVFDDADLDLAVDGAFGCKFRCAGQVCVSANRLLVHESLVDEFAERLTLKVQQLKLGKGVEQDTSLGPLVNGSAVQTVTKLVADAVSKGARLHTGGKAAERDGFFFEPAVLTGATVNMNIARDEIFGPVAAIFSFSTEEQALQLANDTEFGLAGYFYSRDIGRVMRVASRLECGMVGVNTMLISGAENPFGGVKESGLGVEGSKYGLAEYQHIKAMTIGNLDR